MVATLYYKYHTGVIGKFNTLGEGGISYITFQNLSSSHSGGLELAGRNQIYSWWKLISSLNLYYYKVNATNVQADVSSASIGGLVKVLTDFTILKTLDIQLSGNYILPHASAQSKTTTYGYLDVALRKTFFDSRAIISLMVSDVFNTNKQNIVTHGYGFNTTANRKYESRIVLLTITYKFGSTKTDKTSAAMEDYTIELLNEGDED